MKWARRPLDPKRVMGRSMRSPLDLERRKMARKNEQERSS